MESFISQREWLWLDGYGPLYIIYKTLGKLKVQNQDVPKTEIYLLTNNFKMFLGPRGTMGH